MKNLLSVVFTCVITCVLFASCSKENANGEKQNELNGTEWVASYGQNILVIEFTSNTDFQEYMADKEGHVESTGVDVGTYTYSAPKVIFTTHSSSSPFDYATITGNVMELTYKSGYTRTFMKE